jgi:cellobiose phosphorylase
MMYFNKCTDKKLKRFKRLHNNTMYTEASDGSLNVYVFKRPSIHMMQFIVYVRQGNMLYSARTRGCGYSKWQCVQEMLRRDFHVHIDDTQGSSRTKLMRAQ